jgi:hypothetical protein
MIWWFLILACGAGAALWAGISVFLRVRSHMKASDMPTPDAESKTPQP